MANRVVVVTGASSGIGRACAAELAGRGFHVLAGVRRLQDGADVRLVAAGRVEPVLLDVTDSAAIDALTTEVGPSLFALVNNAGLSEPGPVEHLPMDAVRRQFEVMVIAPFALTRALLPALRTGGGRIVNIGSIGGRVALPFLAPYTAAKAALAGFTDALRAELRPIGIEVSLVEPGSVATPIWDKGQTAGQRLLDSLPADGEHHYGDRMRRLSAAARRSAQRGIPPVRVAAAVVHAVTADHPRTRYIVGIDAHVQASLRRLLPDRALDAVMARLAGL